QGEIDQAARKVTGRKDFELYGSGRTDAGVHVLAQVAHLDVSTNLPPETLRRRLNDELPSDINILAAAVVPHRFHARYDAVARRYLYQVATRRTAFAKPFVWWVRERMGLSRRRRAADLFVGMDDFSSFAVAEQDEDASSLVLLERLEVVEDGAVVLFVIEGSHFLWRMVRRMVGVLVAVGTGDLESEKASSFLAERSGIPARLTAPPSGLFLPRVFYKGDRRDDTVAVVTPLKSCGSD